MSIQQRVENSRRLGRLLGTMEADFELENEIQGWYAEHPGAPWSAMPERFREYLEKIEASTQ